MRGLLPVVIVAGLAGCTTTTLVKTEVAHTTAVVGGVTYGPIPVDGLAVESSPGYEPVPWQLLNRDVVVAEGTMDRTEVSTAVVVGAGAGAACCIPSVALLGCCIANPGLVAAPISCLLSMNPGVLLTATQTSTWFTLPLMATGAAVGSTPLLLGLWAQEPPAEYTLVPQSEQSLTTALWSTLRSSGSQQW